MKTNLTSKGKALLLSALMGEELKFTKIVFGNGISDSIEAIANPLFTTKISNISKSEDYVTISAIFNNSEVDFGFRMTEAGVYAMDGDDEILYATAFTDEGSADYIPGKDERLLECQYDLIVFIGEAQNVSAAINGSIVYVSSGDFTKHIEDANNPHKVTKEQVGLGNVPNVSTNDQTPTFENSSKLSELVSGENLSTIFGKVATAVKSLISHIANKNNPHNVTPTKIGAASAKHAHSVADFNSGILSPERGGTGVSSIESFASSVAAASFVTGTFRGEGVAYVTEKETPRIIDLGFHPTAVLVFSYNIYTASANIPLCGLATRGCNAVDRTWNYTNYEYISEWNNFRCWFGIADNGIKLGSINKRSDYYYYIAFR